MIFNQSSINPAGTAAPGTGTLDANIGHKAAPVVNKKQRLQNQLYQTGAVGAAYFIWAINDIPAILDETGGSIGMAVSAALFRIAVVAVPTALIVFRKGYVSAGLVSSLALLMGLGGIIMGESAAGFWHLVFAAGFARGGWAAWRVHKLQS